ncbi:MAG: RecB-like helicase [Arcobacteraceae bacterium]|nr:RecB-like helicase [Arcobacteraceae bacterium]
MEKYLALKASAGSGKTFALTVRYISLLLFDIPPKEILALTFTNKAASEMSERIYKTLFSLGVDEAIISAIVKQTGFSKDQILAKKDEVIKRFISSELSIYTIDKFVNKILREFSGYVGISDDFVIEYDDEELLLYKFLISLDENKFDSLIHFAHIENKKLNSIVTLFKILDEKNERYTTILFPSSSMGTSASNIMDNANQIKQFIENSSLSNSAVKAVDFNDINSLLAKGKTWLTKDTLQDFTYFKKATIPSELENTFIELKQNITSYYQEKEIITLNHLFKIFNDFKVFRDKYNKNRNTLEFSDITNIVYELLQKHIDREFLYFRLDSNYSSILIDEFQDTSVLQYKILEPLIQEILSGSDEKFKTFFYVGDTKQSIYRFRGGTKELFDYVANIFNGELKVEILDVNYRSSKNVVEFVNKNFSGLSNYEYYPQTVNSQIDGLVEVVDFNIEEDEPYKQIAHKIDELIKAGLDVNNIAILTYTNADVLNLYLYLKQVFPNLQITTEMTSKLIQEQNIQAVINAIKYLYFKKDLYKANFNALIGQEFTHAQPDLLPLQKWEQDGWSVPELIKNIATAYKFMDQNIIKFIELASAYDNIVDFIYEIDRLDASMVNKDKSGIQILTVFKSKGLEFDTVFVLDRIKRKNADRSSLLFEYDDINLKNIYLKNSGRENFDKSYENALQKEKKLSIDDELNILYVACTRAKNNMFVFRKSKNSVFDILGTNCNIQTMGQLYIQANKNIKVKEIKEVEYKPLNLGQQAKQIKKEDISDTNIKAKYFGIATHYCLEMMGEFTQNSLDKSIGITKSRYSNILDESNFDDIYQRIQMLINDEDFKAIITNGEYFKEQALIFESEIKILDLLVKKEDKYIICDYKTTTAQKDEHNVQVKYYKQAIMNITKIKNVEAYVVYLQKDKIQITKA